MKFIIAFLFIAIIAFAAAQSTTEGKDYGAEMRSFLQKTAKDVNTNANAALEQVDKSVDKFVQDAKSVRSNVEDQIHGARKQYTQFLQGLFNRQ